MVWSLPLSTSLPSRVTQVPPDFSTMCGRYAFYQRPAEVRQQLENSHMPSQEAPDDDEVRLSYNFAPGYHGLVYRADIPDHGGRRQRSDQDADDETGGGSPEGKKEAVEHSDGEVHYKLQSMKWGE